MKNPFNRLLGRPTVKRSANYQTTIAYHVKGNFLHEIIEQLNDLATRPNCRITNVAVTDNGAGHYEIFALIKMPIQTARILGLIR